MTLIRFGVIAAHALAGAVAVILLSAHSGAHPPILENAGRFHFPVSRARAVTRERPCNVQDGWGMVLPTGCRSLSVSCCDRVLKNASASGC
jgi:hypothetical protein